MTEEIKFEKAMEKLEKIVDDLETGNIALEDALKKYEEGVKLSRLCRERLSQAEKKIEVLTRTLDGGFKKEPFDPQAAEGAEFERPSKTVKSKTKPSARAAEEEGDEDLLI